MTPTAARVGYSWAPFVNTARRSVGGIPPDGPVSKPKKNGPPTPHGPATNAADTDQQVLGPQNWTGAVGGRKHPKRTEVAVLRCRFHLHKNCYKDAVIKLDKDNIIHL